MPLIDTIERFEYRGLNAFEGWCRLHVYENGPHLVVVASEPIDDCGKDQNHGVSVTNAVEIIATLVRTELGYLWTEFVEHYPARGYLPDKGRPGGAWFDESFDLVTFTWDTTVYAWQRPGRPNGYCNPRWAYTTRQAVEILIGEAFPA